MLIDKVVTGSGSERHCSDRLLLMHEKMKAQEIA